VIASNQRARMPATRLKPRIGLSIGVVVERVLAQNAGLGSAGRAGRARAPAIFVKRLAATAGEPRRRTGAPL